jgi:hypothetical protein
MVRGEGAAPTRERYIRARAARGGRRVDTAEELEKAARGDLVAEKTETARYLRPIRTIAPNRRGNAHTRRTARIPTTASTACLRSVYARARRSRV